MALSQPRWEGEPPNHIFVNNASIPDLGDGWLSDAPRPAGPEALRSTWSGGERTWRTAYATATMGRTTQLQLHEQILGKAIWDVLRWDDSTRIDEAVRRVRKTRELSPSNICGGARCGVPL